MMRWLFSPKSTFPVFIGLTVAMHLALQIISIAYYSNEWPLLGGSIYFVSGFLNLLVTAYLLQKGVSQRSQQFMMMGIGMAFLATTLLLLGLGILGIFGAVENTLINTGVFLLISGSGIAAILFLLSPSTQRLKSGQHKILVASILLILFIVGLYQLREQLPTLYHASGIPTLLRQQLITIVMILYTLATVRFALSEWGKSEKHSAQWHMIGMMVLTLIMLNFLLSTRPGDGYSWASRFFYLMASGAFIQYVWWDQEEG